MTDTAPTTPAPQPDAPLPPTPAAQIVPAPAQAGGRQTSAVLMSLGLLLVFGLGAWNWQEAARQEHAQQILTKQQEILSAQTIALQLRVAKLEQAPQNGAPADAVTALGQRLAAIEARKPIDMTALTARLDALESHPSAPTDLAPVLARQADLARLLRAAMALNNGQKLGVIPGAPPALARFADVAPPTLARLRAEFPAVVTAAETASRPSTAGLPFSERMWRKALSLVTVRNGTDVLIGAPASVVLAQAQGDLDAGNLAAAIVTLGSLDPAALAVTAAWRGQAQALLDAQAALEAMANP